MFQQQLDTILISEQVGKGAHDKHAASSGATRVSVAHQKFCKAWSRAEQAAYLLLLNTDSQDVQSRKDILWTERDENDYCTASNL